MRRAATLTVVSLGIVACGGSRRVPESARAPTSTEQPSSPAPQAAVEGDQAATEPTCEEGDQPLGPNCVHEEWLPVGGMNRPFSTVYRLVDGKKVVVWNDQGHVQESTADHLVVVQATMVDGEGMRDIALKCPWSEASYAAECQQTETQTTSASCDACDPSCLDQADSLRTTDPKRAREIAGRACDVEQCGHIGTTMLMRCKVHGFFADQPVVGPQGDGR